MADHYTQLGALGVGEIVNKYVDGLLAPKDAEIARLAARVAELETPPPPPAPALAFGVYMGMSGAVGGWAPGDRQFIPLVGGRKPAVGISYYSMVDGETINEQDRWRVANGIVPQISLETKGYKAAGTVWSWASVAAGTYDTQFQKVALAIAATGGRFIVALDHEADEYVRNGKRPAGDNGQSFVTAWRHVRSVMRAAAPTAKITWAWWAGGSAPHVRDFFPGNDVVELIGADAYKWDHNTNHAATPLQIWKPYWDRIMAGRTWGNLEKPSTSIPRAMTETSTDIAAHGSAEAVKWWGLVPQTARDLGLVYVNFFSRHSDGDWSPYSAVKSADGSWRGVLRSNPTAAPFPTNYADVDLAIEKCMDAMPGRLPTIPSKGVA